MAREFLELFTLGEGRGYSEDDIKEAARALTGHGINWTGSPDYKFHPDQHDAGKKVIFGQRGRFDAADLTGLVINNPDFGPYIVEKLWKTFISHAPDPEVVDVLVDTWKDSDFALEPLMRAILLTDDFWETQNRGALVKTPAELFVGSIRSLGLNLESTDYVRWMMDEMGQQLFVPPNVAGWTGGTAWINDTSVLARAESLATLAEWRGPKPTWQGGLQQPHFEAPELDHSDLRVGSIIILDALKQDDGQSAATYVQLFDVTFRDQTWRSMTVWVEHRTGEPPSIAFNVTDCEPTCFGSWPRAEWDPDIVGFSAQKDWFADYSAQLSDSDVGLMAQVIGHLPTAIQETETQNIWDLLYHEPEYRDDVASFEDVIALVTTLREQSAPILGESAGSLVLAPSRPGLLGLGPSDSYDMSEGDVDMMMNMSIDIREARTAPIIPPQHFDSHKSWLSAIPGDGFESDKAVRALLAVPLPIAGMRQEREVSDADALVRRILLSPLYQVK